MPKLKKSVPSYRRHKASGQAIVTLNGRDFYLGPYGTAVSKCEYDRLIAEWLQQGRHLAVEQRAELCVAEVIVAFFKHATAYYTKGGDPTSEVAGVKRALEPVLGLYGANPVGTFGPLALKVIREGFIKQGLTRGTVNQYVGRIVRSFKWAAENELIDAAIPRALEMVAGLKAGRTEAPDRPPVKPVDDAVVLATLPHLQDVVADMVRIQRLTGCRPAEICKLRPGDVDRSSDVWIYTPRSHKTEHHGRERVIPIGPQAQSVLVYYLARNADVHSFRPIDSEASRRAAKTAKRTTPDHYGNSAGTNRKQRPAWKPGEAYTADSYRQAIHRACDLAFLPDGELARLSDESVRAWERRLDYAGKIADLGAWQKKHRWSPNRLRHTASTEVRRHFGLEASQVMLGHARADVTQIYAERDLNRAVEVARKLG